MTTANQRDIMKFVMPNVMVSGAGRRPLHLKLYASSLIRSEGTEYLDNFVERIRV